MKDTTVKIKRMNLFILPPYGRKPIIDKLILFTRKYGPSKTFVVVDIVDNFDEKSTQGTRLLW